MSADIADVFLVATIAAGAALNTWQYAKTRKPVSLAAAVFCAVMAIATAVIA